MGWEGGNTYNSPVNSFSNNAGKPGELRMGEDKPFKSYWKFDIAAANHILYFEVQELGLRTREGLFVTVTCDNLKNNYLNKIKFDKGPIRMSKSHEKLRFTVHQNLKKIKN